MTMEEEQALKVSKIGQLSRQGAEYHENGDLEKAVECYFDAYNLAREVNNDKTERTCAFNLGAAHIANGNATEGLNYLHKATPPDDQRDERSNGDLYFNMGLGHEKMDNEDKALEDFRRANSEYVKYEREKSDLQIQCLEKCLQIYQKRKDFLNAAEICQQMADVFSGSDELSRAERLCEKATQLRFANKKEEAIQAAKDCKKTVDEISRRGDQNIVAGKILNDLGLVFTQTLEYEDATQCFEVARNLVRNSHRENLQLEAVVLQNLGAAYNFTGDYQAAVDLHEQAAQKYAKISYRNGQGQCFTNLAFALSQLRDLKKAEIAFHHALQAAKDTGDSHMKWQALEGLGAVNFNQGNVNDAADFFIEALKCVGENKTASDRIKDKMLHAINARGSRPATTPHRYPEQMMYSSNFHEGRPFMPTHGPAEEHNQLSATPRSNTVNETPISPKQRVPLTAERPAMFSAQETPPKRRIIPMRKKDSIGPHNPKIARGLASMTYDSPRTSLKRAPLLKEESSEDESSSASGSSSGTSSGEDEADQANQETISSAKIDQIFARTSVDEMGGGRPDEEHHLSQYEEKLRALEANEETEDEDSSDDSSSDDDSEDSDDEASEAYRNDQTNVKQPYSPPPVPTQSPPNTTQFSTKHLGTYLTPDPHLTPDEYVTLDARTPHTVADVQQRSDSSHRVADSPREKSSTESDDDDEDDSDKNDDPYATIDMTTKLRQPVNGQGEEDPYNTLNFERDGPSTEKDENGAMKFESLPRGQKEVIMAQYHHEHSHNQEPPPLPARSDEKTSKTCTIM